MSGALSRLDDLLLSDATDRLSAAERAELDALLAEHQSVDRHAYERAAAVFFLAVCAEPMQQIPDTVRTMLKRKAAQTFEGER